MSQVWFQEYSPHSLATFSPLSRNLEQPLREKARVSVVDRGTGWKVTPKFLMSLVPRISTKKLSRGCNLEMQRTTASENDGGNLCILCAYDRFINATRSASAFWGKNSWNTRVLILMIFLSYLFSRSSDDFDCTQSRFFSLKLKDFSNVIPCGIIFENSFNLTTRRNQKDKMICPTKT